MRSMLLILIGLTSGPLASADPIEDVIAQIKHAPMDIEWVTDAQNPAPAYRMEMTAPGQLILHSKDTAGVAHAYAVEPDRQINKKFDSQMRIKSTTCLDLKPQLRCHLINRISGLQFALRPLDGGPALRPLLLNGTFAGDAAPTSPLAPLRSRQTTGLICDDWSWARNARSGQIEVQSLEVVSDHAVSDIGATVRATLRGVDAFNCAADPRVPCQIKSRREGEPFTGALLAVPIFSWSMELQIDDRRACTVEFESMDSTVLEVLQTKRFAPADGRALSDPEKQKIRQALTPEVKLAFVRAQINEFFDHPNSETLAGDDADLISTVKLPWLSLFNVISNTAATVQSQNEIRKTVLQLQSDLTGDN